MCEPWKELLKTCGKREVQASEAGELAHDDATTWMLW